MKTLELLEVIFVFAGGLGMFLYGMNMMGDGLQKSAGNKLKRLLGYLTNNRLMAVIVGALVTAIIQSSSATTVMMVGFVNAGIMNLVQATGVIMGANIGTTVTAWLVSMSEWSSLLKPDFFAPVLIAVGVLITLICKNKKKKDIAEIVIGLGLLFIGLKFMSDVIKPFAQAEDSIFKQAFILLGNNPLLGILVGAVVTAVIQSSSASVGILQTLAMAGVVNWQSAIFITLGQNIGTCITALLSGIGASKTAKRAAFIHLSFNVIGAAIFGALMYVIFRFQPNFAASGVNSTQISIFHTIFNLTNTIILFPFAKGLVKLSGLFIDDSKIEIGTDEVQITLRHLDERILETPSFAVQNAIKEVVHMGEITLDNTREAVEALLNNNEEKARKVFEVEKVIDVHQKIINEYLVKINNLSLTDRHKKIVNNLFHTVSNIERVGDHADNLAELAIEKATNDLYLSDDAYKELKEICNLAIESFDYALKARETENRDYILKVEEIEKTVDTLKDDLRQKHINRLSEGVCTSENGVIFIDALINLERISDHSLNIANFVDSEIVH
ncbi:MAG: Na/Pi cotransporter family protein [Clostridiales bacterium]|jgi:phosphate:Na+ symporter|nr:Na/Pi cotransporter family protein [Clostridiales bacterium]